MDRIMDIAKKNDLYVIEDAAHAIGSKYKNKNIGSIGDITCFSFYATKNITTAEGGMITTNNGELADKMRILSLHGISKDAWKRYSSEGSWYYEYYIPDINQYERLQAQYRYSSDWKTGPNAKDKRGYRR